MALTATVHRVRLVLADVDRGHYDDYRLTLACHPSETAERLMVRLLAYALHAGPSLAFGRGISTDDEPDLWQHRPDGQVQLWIEVGLPDVRRLRRAGSRSEAVWLYIFGSRAADVWWKNNRHELGTIRNLHVRQLAPTGGLEAFVGRSMELSCTIQDQEMLLSAGTLSATVLVRQLEA